MDNRLYNQTQKFTLSASISLSDTSIALSSFNLPDGTAITSSDLGTINYATLEPGTSREESITFVSLTGTTLTTVVRGVRFDAPYTQDTSLRKAHSAGAILVLSNTAAFYDSFANKENDETINGTYSYTVVPNSTAAATSGDDLVNLTKLNAAALGSASIDQQIIAGTAGTTIASGEIVYFDSTAKEWLLADASIASSSENIILGVAQGAGTDGVAISGGVLISGLDTTQSGMTAGTKQFLSDTAGDISESAGTKEVSIGYSQSGSTTKLIFSPRFDQQITEDEQDALVGSSGTPSSTNKYVTANDQSRNQNEVGFSADAEASDTYVITLSPAPTAYVTGMLVSFSANTANTGAATINVNGLGAKSIKKLHDQDLATGDIESGQIIDLRYDGTNFQMQSQTAVSLVTDIQTFTASGNWTKPSGAKSVEVHIFGGGGGGGSGKALSDSTLSNNVSGGSAGGAGAYGYKRFLADGFSSSETVAIGSGGTGGASASEDADGNNGGTGGTSSFGTDILKVGGGGAGQGGSASTETGATGAIVKNGDITQAGGDGGDSGLNAVGVAGDDTALLVTPRGGGGGGGARADQNTNHAGAVGGGFITNYVKAGGAVSTIGNASNDLIFGGTGGGGGKGEGRTSGAATGLAGGAGISGSGGGGGGAAYTNEAGTATSGAGGTGGDGLIIVITYI